MSLRATIAGGMTALGIVLAAAPAHAQQTTPTNQSTPTPVPAPSKGAIGNPALENFDLGGSVNREPRPPAVISAPPISTSTASPAPTRSAPPPASTAAPRDSVASPAPGRDAPAPTRSVPESVSSAPPSPTLTAPDTVTSAPVTQAPDPISTLMPPVDPATGGPSLWPWLAALAVALAAAGAWWFRKQRGEADSYAFAGAQPSEPAPAPVARRVPSPSPAPAPAPAPRPVNDGGIVSRALQPKLAFDLSPMLFETDEAGNVRLTFELIVANLGGAPARDIQVEAKMFNAGPTQDTEIGAFFGAPGALGAKLPPLAPHDRMPLRSRIGMTAADYKALEMAGRSLVVPMVAVNAIYRGPGGQNQDSASWMVGRPPKADSDASKLGPFGLGKAQAVNALAALPHSAGLNR